LSGGTVAATHSGGRVEPTPLALEQAIVRAVAYADVFDYPLTADEVHRYLVGVNASLADVHHALGTHPLVPGLLSTSNGYFSLLGRESAVVQREQRAANSARYWRRAVGYGRAIGDLPFVRMVAVTGALAMDNVADDDIDYLIVTEPGRLWLCRALVIGVVRLAAARGVTLCPNYFLSERALALPERNLFTAHEVTQMVPLSGFATYRQLRELNDWTFAYLPNAEGPPRGLPPRAPRGTRARGVLEASLRSRLGGRLERWEMSRKVRKFTVQGNGHLEAAFSPDWCKGHFGDHGNHTLARYAERLRGLEGTWL
jgi:hypothetical protein